MGDLLTRFYISQCDYGLVIVITGIGLIGMVDVLQVTANLEAMFMIDP